MTPEERAALEQQAQAIAGSLTTLGTASRDAAVLARLVIAQHDDVQALVARVCELEDEVERLKQLRHHDIAARGLRALTPPQRPAPLERDPYTGAPLPAGTLRGKP